jgi:hypothetical protein
MSPDRLIYMANQIGKFFESQGHDRAVPGIAEHRCGRKSSHISTRVERGLIPRFARLSQHSGALKRSLS